MRSALVLAGEGSAAPGELATVDGTATVRRIAEQMPESVDELVVSCTSDQRDAVTDALDDIDHRLAVEPGSEYRPIAALRTGFRIATGSAVAVFDCTTAEVNGDLLASLFETVDTAAVPQADGYLYPLHAVYDRYAGRQAAERTLATGSDRLYDLLAQIDPVVVDASAVGQAALSAESSRAPTTSVISDPSG